MNIQTNYILPMLVIFLLSLGQTVYSANTSPDGAQLFDEVMVYGQTLRGRIIRLESQGVVFETLYGTGSITIPYADIVEVKAHETYHIVYGDDHVAIGRLLDIKQDRVLIGESATEIIQVPVEEIAVCLLEKDYQQSFWKRLKTNYRHWKAGLSLGIKYEQGAVDKRKIELGLNTTRRKRPTRFVFDIRYAFETQKTVDQPEETTKDEFNTFLLGEYDFYKNFYLFIRPAAERDIPRLIKRRTYPAGGIGYRLVEKERSFLLLPIGLGYVDETFIGFGTNSYTAAFIGMEGSYEFVNGMILALKILYMPGLDDPSHNWLFRGVGEFTIPIYDPLALKIRVTDENDNNPDPAVGNNKFTTTLALIFRF
jgi:hypothetical protein